MARGISSALYDAIDAALTQADSDGTPIGTVAQEVLDQFNIREIDGATLGFSVPSLGSTDFQALKEYLDGGAGESVSWLTAFDWAATESASATGTQANFWKYLFVAIRALKRDNSLGIRNFNAIQRSTYQAGAVVA